MEKVPLNKQFTPRSSLPTSQSSNLPISQPPNLPAAQSPNRLVIAAPQGRSGKTTVALGLCAALAARGLAVQPFKKGPDYIDPSWLTEAAGRACRTLDPFFLISQDEVRRAFLKGASGADISLIEGNHGLYDSLDDEGTGSTAAVARWLQAPIILVVNAARMSRSVAALVRGYQTFEPGTLIAAVVLNNVAQNRHELKLRNAIESHCRIPVIGALPRSDTLTIPDRHLGLVPRAEDEALIPAIEACRQAVEQYVDLDAILTIARAAPPIGDWRWEIGDWGVEMGDCLPPGPARTGWRVGQGGSQISDFRFAVSNLPSPISHLQSPISNLPSPISNPQLKIVIGILRDRAFTFYYPENLEALVDAGGELVFIDALRDSHLPGVDALYIGGGFPEIFMHELSANRHLRLDIRAAAGDGMPIYAECGGLMYLSRRIIWGDQSAEMAGVLPCDVEVTGRPQGHGYVIGEALEGNPFLPAGTVVRGHEFHHSRIVNWQGELPTAYRLIRGNGLGGGRDGLVYRNVLAAYTHLHAAGSPGWAAGLVARAGVYANEVTHAAL